MAIRVMIVDDHRIMREGLRSLIERERGMEVCGEAADGRSAIDLAQETNPDVIVMDLTMPGLNGIEAIRQIRADCPETKLLALSMHSDSRFVDGALKAGASGYLLKDCAFEELVEAIRILMRNRIYMAPKMLGAKSAIVLGQVAQTSRDDVPNTDTENGGLANVQAS